MRKIYILVALVMAATSCSKWLDVTPDNMVIEKELFKTATGCQNALNGIYGNLSGENLYGRELTYGFVDVLSQNYVVGNSSIGIKKNSYYTDVAGFRYKENQTVKNAINGIWSSGYTAIANCNILLSRIDQVPVSLFLHGQYEKDLIKGEALGLRAMMHFDILRIFAAAPITNDTKSYIPYVTVSPYYGGQSPETVESIMKKVEVDLLEAKALILKYDTLSGVTKGNLNYDRRFNLVQTSASQGHFLSYRGYRLNALAVTGMLARVYNYWGKHDEAKKQAEEVMNFTPYQNNSLKAVKYTTSQLTYDRKFTQDLFFAVSDVYQQNTYKDYSTISGKDNLILNKKLVQFENAPTSHGADVRFVNLLDKTDSRGYLPLKNVRKESSEDIVKITEDIVPLMRLGEMELIMAEYYASKGDFVNADMHINNLRAGRKCTRMSLGITDMATFKANLFIEARKEFFQEGQIFYYYKKYNELITKTMSPESFIIPTPDSENIN